MFYIDKKQRRWRDNTKDIALMHIGPALIVFLAFFGLTIWSIIEANDNVRSRRDQVLSQDIQQTKTDIKERIRIYEDVLRAGVGLFGASDNVTRNEWKQFINIFELPKRYPGIQAVGYIEKINNEDLQSHVESAHSEGLTDYIVRPAGYRPVYYVVTYIDPATSENNKVLGFDLYSENQRQKAMDLARDTGKVTLSDKLSIIQDDPVYKKPGFLMFLPIYKRDTSPENIEQRRSENTGYIYAAFRTKDLLDKLQISQDRHFGFQLYDGVISSATQLYESPSFKKINASDERKPNIQQLTVNNQKWILVSKVDDSVVSSIERSRPVNVLWGGILFSIFVSGFIYLLLLNRARVLAHKDQLEIQEAKDELLALASHQLRTPATGVKQYVGLLREGYAGKLNKKQKKYIDKAYASNERQLSTINEMLFVAHADAGTIKLTSRRLNLSSIVRDICDEQSIDAKKNNQQLTSILPKKSIYIYADRIYVRMAIENIVNNALKYTPHGGKINVKLSRKKEFVQLVVEDNGVGVSKKNYPLLFQKFSRIPNELTGKVSGSGIGLYLAKNIIEAHGGKITFKSQENVGSSCIVKLPINTKNKIL
ncbi:CHASE domain-containing protein [Candidatus Saccharibacteria bacterium]|nr:CHASE domain-containing protein [Candidatus Saccharibacteria bacterium]